jgi:hypothetical protein
VQLGSRPRDGERLRSNLQEVGRDTEDTRPYPGGPAIVDDILFVPLDQPLEDGDPTGQIVLFDLRPDPLTPTPIQAIELDHAIDNLGVTRQDDGTYLLWTNGDGGSVVRLYETTTSDLRDPGIGLTKLQDWDPFSGLGCTPGEACPWFTGTGAHQSSTFLRTPDGSLYLIGMRHPGGSAFSGEDWADLYRVADPSPGNFQLTYLKSRHLYCRYDGGGGAQPMRICNFAAADTAYVTPSGELILYSIPHDDEDGFSPTDIVRVGEFRHGDVNRENSPLRLPTADAGGPYTVEEGGVVDLAVAGQSSADRPWVELYDDASFEDRSIVFDFDHLKDLEFWNFSNGADSGLDDFNDKTTSIRWRTPVGLNVRIFDDSGFKDRNLILGGRGRTQWLANVGAEDATVTADADDVGACVADPTQAVCVAMRSKSRDAYAKSTRLDFNDKTSSLKFEWEISDDHVPTEIVVRYLTPDYGGSGDDVADIETRYSLDLLNEQPTCDFAGPPPGPGVDCSPDPTLLVRRYQNPAGDAIGTSDLLEQLNEESAVRSAGPGSVVDLTWDLDGDGFFGETDAAATRGDEIGGSPTFVAADLDGPSQVVVTLHATDSGNPGADTAVIDVTNAEPVATVERITDETGAEIGVDVPFALVGLRIDMTGSFTDPGVLDTHTASVDWGDGTLDDLGDVVVTLSGSHAYPAAREYTIALAVEDDDGGICAATRQIAVVDASAGLSQVADLLRPLSGDRNVRRALAELEGQAGGRAANGAIDLLGKGNLNAALVKIERAMKYLEAADPSLDLGRIKSLLALSAKSARSRPSAKPKLRQPRGDGSAR